MKFKKILTRILLGMCCLMGVTVSTVTLVSCKDTEVEEQKFTVSFVDQDGKVITTSEVGDGKTVSKPTNPTLDGYTFKHWSLTKNGEPYDFSTPVTANLTLYAVWEKNPEPVTTYTVTFVSGEGASTIPSQTVESGKAVIEPSDPTLSGYTFKHWSLTKNGEAYDFSTPVTANLTLYAVWEKKQNQTEVVTRTLDLNTPPAGMVQQSNADYYQFASGEGTVGYFELLGEKLRYEVSQKAINTQGGASVGDNSVAFTTTSAGTLTFEIKNASGSNTGLVLLDSEGNVVQEATLSTNQELSSSFEITEAGTYYFGGKSGSIRIFALSYTETVAKSEPKAIEVTTLPEVNFLEKSEFNSDGLIVTLIYENGRTEVVTPTSIKALTALEMATPGEHVVDLEYIVNEQTFKTNYKVTVYALDSIQWVDYDYDGDKTLIIQKLFLKGSTFDSSNVVVEAFGKATVNGKEVTHQFILEADDYTVSNPDLTTVGSKEVIITSKLNTNITTSYLINVVEDVLTDKEAATVSLNVVAGAEVLVSADSLTFGSINDALKYLELVKVSDSTIKNITIGEGTFNEKVEVTLPNVHLNGATTVEANFDSNGYLTNTTVNNKTIITYGAYNGLTVPSGNSTYSTDGSATVSIRNTAVGFYAQGITFANDINTLEEYNKVPSSNKQAVALLVQADQSHFYRCSFTGYQDTLYAQVGRQIYDTCYIEGRTDYIFGYDATAVFTNSEIHSFGANNDAKNGGYVVATKGSEKLNYGYLFMNVAFTASDDVTPGTVSLARGWDKYMTMAVMHSNIGQHISKETYGEATMEEDGVTPSKNNKNDRYGKMNAEPDPNRLVENGNIGLGAITTSLENTCTVIDNTAAEKYMSLVNIFGKDTNGLPYENDWTGGIIDYTATITYHYGEGMTHVEKDYEGTTIDKLWTAPIVEGMTFIGWYTTSTFDESSKFDPNTKLTANLDLYAKYDSGVVLSENLRFDSLTDKVGKNEVAIDGQYLTITNGGAGDWTVLTPPNPAVADNDPTKQFTTALMHGGSTRDCSITAKRNVTVTIYFNTGDSGFQSGNVVTKGGELTIDGVEVSNKSNKVPTTTAVSYTFDMTAGQTCVLNASSNRLILFGIDVVVK